MLLRLRVTFKRDPIIDTRKDFRFSSFRSSSLLFAFARTYKLFKRVRRFPFLLSYDTHKKNKSLVRKKF